MNNEPMPLKPLGPTDAYTFANGVIVYWSIDGINARIHASADSTAVIVPMHLFPIIVAVLVAMGLSDIDASLVAEAAEAQRVRTERLIGRERELLAIAVEQIAALEALPRDNVFPFVLPCDCIGNEMCSRCTDVEASKANHPSNGGM